ncbi:Ig-like domain-containing protein [Paenibacillus beijingensis]|uniref:Ig-like domain-containing protein n=1 Tax=Paenibacillus beijingensis TaxID=1126833 RepID=UPI0006982197|nr:Ig-like domain-containing protein [Paenibacillus beijingensis]
MKKKSLLPLLLTIILVVTLLPAYAAAEGESVSVTLGENVVDNGITPWSGDGPGGVTKETVQGKSGWKTNPAAGAKYIYLNVRNTFINGGTNAVTITIEYFDSIESANNTFFFSYDSVANPWDSNIPKTYLTGSNTWKTVTYSLKDANFANRENGADIRIETTVPTLIGGVTVEKSTVQSAATSIQAEPSEVSMYIGTSTTAVAAVLDQQGFKMNKLPISWSSSDAATAKVDSTGKITSLKLGTAVITANNGSLTASIPVTVTEIDGPVSVTLGAYYKENGLSAVSGDGAGRTTETYDGRSGWQTNPASGAHYIYGRVDDNYIFGGKNTVKITVDYYDAAVTGEKGFLIAYDSVLTPYAYTEKTLLKGSNTWKQATYLIEDAQFGNRENNGADFRIETSVPVCIAEITVELIPTVSMRGAHVTTGSIFKDGEPSTVNLVFDNQFDTGKELNVSYNVLDYSNSVVNSGGFNVSLEPEQKGLVKPLAFGVLKKGTYTVSVDAVSPDGAIKLHEEIHMGSIADLTGKPKQSFLGFNTHFDRGYGGSDIRTPLVVQAGAVSIRDGFTSGNPTYIDNAAANGLSTFIVTRFDLAFIEQVATSLQGKVNAFEIGNELSTILTPQQYFDILQDAYTIIKGIDPNMKVVGGVTLPYDEPWLKALVDLGATSYLDGMSFHTYPSKNPEQGEVFTDFQDLKQYIENYHASHGITKDIELWLTEIGWPTMDKKWGGFTEIDSASYGAQLVVTNMANDVLIDQIYWYDFLNDCTDSKFYECSQGVLYVDNSPKPSFVAFNNVSNQLGGAAFVESYNTLDNDVRIYKFHRASDNQDILAIWSNVDKQIGLNLGSSPLQVTDLFGNVKSYETVSGNLTFTATAAPVYIAGSFGQAPVLAAPTFTVNPSVVEASPEEEVQFTVTRAAGAEALSGTYEAHLPLGWQLVSGGTFSAGQTTDTLTVRAPETQSSGEVHIYAKGTGGELYGSMKLDAQMKDAVVVLASPVLNSTGNGWDLAVTINNQNSLEPMSGGTVTVLEPADMAGIHAFDPIAPGSSTTIKIPAPSISIDTPLLTKVQVDRDDGYSQLIERNMSALTSVRAVQPILIDGVIDDEEWSNSESFTLDQASQVRLITDWGGPEDLSATAYTKWDSDHLYLAVRVTDNIHFNNNPPGDSWKGDSIQFAIDPGRAIEPGKLGWNENTIALNSVTNAVMKRGGIGGNNLLNSPIIINRDGNETVYEMAIKWTDILPVGMIPSTEYAIGFSLLVNDNDGSLRRGWMEYMSGIGLTKNPLLFGDLILTDRTQLSDGTLVPTSIAVDPASATLNVGASQSAQATVYDQNNEVMNGIQVNWSSSDPAVATVDATGTITAVAAGTAVVTAAYGNLSADINVTVNPVVPQSTVVISDTFSGTNGSTINGRVPDTANLPGSEWSVLNFAANGSFSGTIKGDAGNPAPEARLVAGGNAKGAIAIPIASSSAYEKPTKIRIEADLSFAVKATQHVGLGFYSALPQQGSGEAIETNFSGLRINNTTGAITLFVNGQAAGPEIAYTGTWDPQSSFHQLAYTVDTVTGAISDVTFAGSASDYSFATSGFTDAATAYAAALIGSTFSRDHTVNVDNFKVSGLETPTSIVVNPASATLNVGETQTVQATVYNQNNEAINGIQVTWSSSDPAVATVDSTGTIAAAAPGTAVVTAAYGSLNAGVNVTVNPPVPQSNVVISDTFSGTNGSTINGRVPDTANLPGSEWSVLNFAANGSFSGTIKGDAGNPAPEARLVAGGNAKGAIAIPIASSSAYEKPTKIRIEADLSFAVKATQHVGLGFYSALPQQGSGEAIETNFSGLRINNTTGAITLFVNGQAAGPEIAYTGTWDPQSSFHQLAYTVDTVTGAISDVTFAGSASDYSFATSGFSDAATAYAAALIGSTFSRDHTVNLDNFKVSGISGY